MKKINLFCLLCLLGLVLSCDGDDETMTSSDDVGLIGTWNLQTLDYTGTSATTTPYGSTSADFDGEAKDISTTITFRDDNTYVASGDYTITLTTDFDGYTFEQDVVFSDFLGTGVWERDGDIVRTTADGQTEAAPLMIVELDDSSLIFDFTTNQTTVMQGTSSAVTVDGRYTFDR